MLPPLVPGVNVPQPNLSPQRSSVLEVQRMKAAVSGQFQATVSDRDRQVQQLDVQLTLLSGGVGPKLTRLDRRQAFDAQTLEDIAAKVAELEQNILPRQKATSERLQMRFEQDIQRRSQVRIKLVADNLRQNQADFDATCDGITGKVAALTDAVRALGEQHSQTAARCGQAQTKTRMQIEGVRPRVTALEMRLAALSSAIEAVLRSAGSVSNLEDGVRRTRKNLDALEGEWVSQIVQNSMAETFLHLSIGTNAIEQKIREKGSAVTNIDDGIRAIQQQQDQVDDQVNVLSTTLVNTKGTLDKESIDINDRLNKLENDIEALKTQVEKTVTEGSEQGDSNSNWATQALTDDVDAFRAKMTVYLNKRKDEWTEFDKANSAAQKLIDDQLKEVGNVLNQDLQARVVAAEKRVKWCVDRVTVWHKEAEKRQKLKADNEAVAAMEKALIAIERDIPDQHGTKGEFEPGNPVPLDVSGNPPVSAQVKDSMEPFTLPDELKLTYAPEDDVDDFPQPEKRDHGAAPEFAITADSRPQDVQPQDGQLQDDQPDHQSDGDQSHVDGKEEDQPEGEEEDNNT
jgi:archaellum component FlaC